MPEEFRRFTRAGRRAILDADGLIADLGETIFVCVPKAALAVARALIINRGYWRTTYAKTYGDGGYYTPDDADLDLITGALDEFMEATTEMSCEELNSNLATIAAAIAAAGAGGGCNCGSGGTGDSPPPTNPDDTGDITEPTGTPPDGYTSWGQYQIEKCNVANWIVDNILQDIAWIDTSFLVAGGTLALAAGLLSLIPGVILVILLAAIAAVLLFESGAIAIAEDAMFAGRDDLVCAVYTGENTQESMDNYIAQMVSIIGGTSLGVTSTFLIEEFLKLFAQPSSFNLLYADADIVAQVQVPQGGDCSQCGGGCNIRTAIEGVLVADRVWESTYSGGAHRIGMIFNTTLENLCGAMCGPMAEFIIESISGWTDAEASLDNPRIWHDSDCAFTGTNASVLSTDDIVPVDQLFCGRYLYLTSGTPFTIVLEVVGQCL